MREVTLNCDMGESFGLYSFGADRALMPLIDTANVACGFHGSDFNHMRETVRLAKQHGVTVGAHPSLPDLQGFGRREMAISRTELANCILYQVGALSGFLAAEGMKLSHIKPHGSLYGMTAREDDLAHAVADVADVFRVPIFGLAGTAHEAVYAARGHELIPEFFADLDYDEAGKLIITREHHAVDPDLVLQRTIDAVEHGRIVTASGKHIPLRVGTICIHSDTPNAVEIAGAVATGLKGKPALIS
ncbi:MAG: 5-oxoprolinase subunit PxpA [Rhizobiaceae bacterium]